MLNKILVIKNVGRFKNYSTAGSTDFRKLTLIYSENGKGKTTLAAILRSIASGDVAPLKARKTLGEATPSRIELQCSLGVLKYDGTQWSDHFRNVEIFDTTFVNQHVYSGANVDHSHKQRLHRFAIGDEGVRLAKQIGDLDQQSRELAGQRSQKEQEVKACITGSMSVNTFLKLAAEASIDTKIEKAIADVAAVAKSADLQKRPELFDLSAPQVDTDEIVAVLGKTLESISADAIEKTRDHIKMNLGAGAEAWIATGLDFMKDENCPFCHQDTSGVTLIGAFKTFFDKQYAELQAELRRIIATTNNELAEAKLATLEGRVSANHDRATGWREYVSSEFPELDMDELRSAFTNIRKALLERLGHKAASPLDPVGSSPELLEAIALLNSVSARINRYNECAAIANAQIRLRKAELEAGDFEKLKAHRDVLTNTKARHVEPAKTLCAELEEIVAKKNRIEADKKKTKDLLEETTQALLKTYEERINHHLRCFGASFEIAETGHRYAGGSPSSVYRLVINGERIDLGDSTTSPDQPTFATALSDGDKSTLAFAFFLARLEQDAQLSQKVVVFDDPISSLDWHRKDCTQQAICSLSRDALQVIVCSHDALFLRSVWDGCPNPKSAVQITQDNNGSKFIAWEIEAETRGEYFKRVNAMQSFVSRTWKGNSLYIAKCIRPVLETNLRIRFPTSFRDTEWLGNFISKIRDAVSPDPLVAIKPKLREIEAVNDYSKSYHHGDTDATASSVINETALEAYCKRTLALLSV